MADVSPLKKNLQIEELRTGAAASESTMQRVASSVNFWNNYYEGSRGWFLNGTYSIMGTPQVGVDGAFFANSNMEIYQVGVYNLVAGTSGSLIFDIIKHPVGGGAGTTIFSTKPVIPFSTGNNARILTNTLTNTNVFMTPGCTAPALVSTQLNAGDFLTCNLFGAQALGQSAGIILALRPR